ncbi:MAG TPA: hypothetical protein PK252_10525 [Bacteroidales bacterium]|nr:hypothetical protein [Bacteroidales bacterium]
MKKITFLLISIFTFGICATAFSQANKKDVQFLFIEAIANKKLGNYYNAAVTLDKLIRADSTCLACYYEMADIMMKSKDQRNAIFYASKAFEKDSSNYWYALLFADVLKENGYFIHAAAKYKYLLDKFGEDPDIMFDYGLMLKFSGNTKEANNVFFELYQKYGLTRELGLMLADIFNEMDKPKEGIAILNKLVKIDSFDAQIAVKYGDLYFSMKSKSLAEKYYAEALMLDSLNSYILYRYIYFLFQTKNSQAFQQKLYSTITNDSLSIEFRKDVFSKLSFISQREPKLYFFIEKVLQSVNVNLYVGFADVFADFYELNRNFKSALMCTKALYNGNKNELRTWERLLYYFNNSSQFDSTLWYYKNAEATVGVSAFMVYMAAIAAYSKENYKLAVNIYLNGLQNTKFDNDQLQRNFLLGLGDSYYMSGNLDSAIVVYAEVFKKYKPDNLLYNNLAYYLAEKGVDLIKAAEMSRLTITAEPKNPTFLDTYAWICFKLGNYTDALFYIKETIKYSKYFSKDVYLHLYAISVCTNEKGLAAKALKALKKNLGQKFQDKLVSDIKCK